MSLQVTIGQDEQEATPQESGHSDKVRINLDIRKSLNGDLMIFDHGDIDIVLSPGKNKVVCFPKDMLSDTVYYTSNQLMSFLSKKGIIDPETIQAGSIHGTLEADLNTSEDYNVARMTILNISKWIDLERPYFEFVDKFDDLTTSRFTDPEEEESTELGEVPHDETKGTLRPGYNYGPYWQNYTL